MTWGGWFLVWLTATGQPMQIGPFLHERTCAAAIENAREERESDHGGGADWHLPQSARCEQRDPTTRASWPRPYSVEGRW